MIFLKTLTLVILAMISSLIFGPVAHGSEYISMSRSVFYNSSMPFNSHRGDGPFDTTLAMNVQYGPIKVIRSHLSEILGYDLQFFKLWNQSGEAHITAITPPEYSNVIKNYVSIERIEQIALQMGIQFSDLSIFGIGRGEAQINGKIEETFFIIVNSQNLLRIRQQIYKEYLQNGGPADAWNPNNYFPHITIGFSLRDLHEADGVIKYVDHSFDSRFKLFLTK